MRDRFVIPYKSVEDKTPASKKLMMFDWEGCIWIDDRKYHVLASRNEEGWEHVSVSTPPAKKLPSWDVLSRIKNCFWNEDEDVIHWIPKQEEYVNLHPNCMHLWKIRNVDMGDLLDKLAKEHENEHT